MNILVWTCRATILLSCVLAKNDYEEHHVLGYRRKNKTPEEREAEIKRNREIHIQKIREYKPDYDKFKDALTYSEQLARRPLNPNSCRREYVNSKNYTRKSLLPEYLICESMFKNYGENVEKAALESLERRYERARKEREEKEKKTKAAHEKERSDRTHTDDKEKAGNHEGRTTTVHPLYRTRRTVTPTTTQSSTEIKEASSTILHELDAKRRRDYTGDSAHYEELYHEMYKDVPTEESKSVSSDYSSFERWYDDRMKRPYNETTPHYEWWTYNPNDTFEEFNGKPLHLDRALYSLKMSSILPANVSAEVDAMYNQKSIIDVDFANARKKSMEEWGKTVNMEYNSDAGPVPERRELREPLEIMQNRYYDVEQKLGFNLEKDVQNKFIKPMKKGLYHFKHWMNANYTTTTRKPAMTWPAHSLNDEEMVDMYKKYLREERNVSVSDSAGISIFEKEKYQFTGSSNYYDEDRKDLPWETLDPY